MDEVKEPLKYKDEAEKNAALTAIQDRPGGARPEDIEEIDRISEAEVEVSPEVEPEEESGLPESEEEEKPLVESEEKVEPEDTARNFQITEELISEYDDEYTDENGRRRKFVTQKNPGDLLKSYVSAQKNNHYLKTQRIPQEKQAGYDQAKAEYEEKFQAMQKEMETLKAQPPEKKETPVQKPVETETRNQLNTVMEKLNGISDEDTIENTGSLREALILSEKLRGEDSTRYADDINNLKADIDTKINAYRTEQDQKEQQRVATAKEETDRQKQQEILNNVYTELDEFAAGKDAPKDVKTNQKFIDMQREALAFHDQLGELYTGKLRTAHTQQDWANVVRKAELDYLNGVPELVAKAKASGIDEPKNYGAWKTLDGIDAMRGGWVRNSSSNVWEERFSKSTGKRVNLGDVKTAYKWWLDETGQMDKKIADGKREEVDKVLGAVNKRDKGMVQLDESKLIQDGDGQPLTEAQANEILRDADMDFVKAEEMKGNHEPLNRVNAAMDRLKYERIPVSYEQT